MRMLNLCLSLLLALGLGVSSGCSKSGEASEPQPGASQGNEAPPAPATGTTPLTKLSDGQIAEILTTVDTGEIQQAKVALNKTSNADVRTFATQMVDEHTKAKEAGAQLVAQASLTPAESPISTNLRANSDKVIERLNAADAASFDQTYISAQVDQHAEVLKLIDDQLLPGASETPLRDHLTTARGLVQRHLEHAQRLKK